MDTVSNQLCVIRGYDTATVKTEAAGSLEILTYVYESTRLHIPENENASPGVKRLIFSGYGKL